MRHEMSSLLLALGWVLGMALLTGCQTTGGMASTERGEQGSIQPSGDAPAPEMRAKHHYHYYPAADVYFDLDRRLYFYLSDGTWVKSAALPLPVDAELGPRVVLEMDSARPYEAHAEHKKAHPPVPSEANDSADAKRPGRRAVQNG